jgi:hypothetical protein
MADVALYLSILERRRHRRCARPDPRDYREEAQAAAEWFVANHSRLSTNDLCQSRGGVVMPLFGKWRRKDIYQNTEDRTPATLSNYFLNVAPQTAAA